MCSSQEAGESLGESLQGIHRGNGEAMSRGLGIHMNNAKMHVWLKGLSMSFKDGAKRTFAGRYADLYVHVKPRRLRSFKLENRIKLALQKRASQIFTWDEFFHANATDVACQVKPKKRMNTYQIRLKIKGRR
jgi:hypothetical protein